MRFELTKTSGTAVAIGPGAGAAGEYAVALGAGTSADHDASAALGAGAKARSAGEVMLGGPGSSCAFGDIAASSAAQFGPTDIVTVDADGRIGRDATMGKIIADLSLAVATLKARLSSLEATRTEPGA